jgi:hypothetical protein
MCPVLAYVANPLIFCELNHKLRTGIELWISTKLIVVNLVFDYENMLGYHKLCGGLRD